MESTVKVKIIKIVNGKSKAFYQIPLQKTWTPMTVKKAKEAQLDNFTTIDSVLYTKVVAG